MEKYFIITILITMLLIVIMNQQLLVNISTQFFK